MWFSWLFWACKTPGPSAGNDSGAAQVLASASAQAAALSSADLGSAEAGAMGGGSQALVVSAKEQRTRARSASKKGESVELKAGTHEAGSAPGEEGREPGIEPALVPVELGAFEIDALPYPGDPSSPPRTVGSAAEAERLCAEQKGRLCSELEWEHACKGPDGDAFVSGAAWDPVCDKEPNTCVSGYGVRAMGTQREWVKGGTRGAQAGAPIASRRCAKRTQDPGGAQLAFRCCRGPESKAVVPEIETKPAFRKAKLDAAQIGKIFGAFPELARIGTEIRLFEGEVQSVVNRSNAAHEGITFTGSPTLWSPELGVEVLVVTGRTKNLSFVVALYAGAADKYRLASSFLMLGDVAPVALAYNPQRRKELLWSSCWGCSGEQGSVSLRDDHRVVIVQH